MLTCRNGPRTAVSRVSGAASTSSECAAKGSKRRGSCRLKERRAPGCAKETMKLATVVVKVALRVAARQKPH